MPFLSESWLVVLVVLLITAATLALVVVAGRCFLNISILAREVFKWFLLTLETFMGRTIIV